ncbi:gamma carbonic anhydrase-like 1, mitochondrial [Durio zibethinus]|uniref:Gamma carbonic anhydrase-like 1, mitochondrial n=1 Tax=Durio zibethinus TaxID=66656 RepID=A0A6P5WIY4_DURZI|nr:gamma carbonic anhydrase-like 1, mitochondrial [Durio zibethinus]
MAASIAARVSIKAAASAFSAHRQCIGSRSFVREAAKTISPSSDLGVRKVAVDTYVAPNVVLASQVTVNDGASVWNGCVLRGDLNKITVGFCSNVQNGVSFTLLGPHLPGCQQRHQLRFEKFVTIGTYSLLKSCTIEPECFIGQHSILIEGSLVEETHSILEAGSVVPPGRRIPPSGELWAGNPARFVRALTHEEALEIPKLAVAIYDLSKEHFSEFLTQQHIWKLRSSRSPWEFLFDCFLLSFFPISVYYSFPCKEINSRRAHRRSFSIVHPCI